MGHPGVPCAGAQVVPERWRAARRACMELHPGWEFRLWTDEDAARLVQEAFPGLWPTFRAYRFSIQRADAIRRALHNSHLCVI